MPTGMRRKPSKLEPINLEEIEQDPGLRGMLSFLEIPPEERARLIALRQRIYQPTDGSDDRVDQPMGYNPVGGSVHPLDKTGHSTSDRREPPMGNKPMGFQAADSGRALLEPSYVAPGSQIKTKPPMGQSPMGGITLPILPQRSTSSEHRRNVDGSAPTPFAASSDLKIEQPSIESPSADRSIGELLAATEANKNLPPYMDIAGIGRRRLRYCTSVQDAHTSGELVAYQALWTHAKRAGRADSAGFVVDLGLKEICFLWKTDHKHAKRLLTALAEKQNIEVIRQPNYQLGLATRYRIFNFSQIHERRRARGLVWVVRTRTTKFVDLQTVNQLIVKQPTGQSPTGDLDFDDEVPMGQQPYPPTGERPEAPMGQPPVAFLIKESSQGNSQGSTSVALAVVTAILHDELNIIDNNAAERIVNGCRAKAPDATAEEIGTLCRYQAQRFRKMQYINNPVAMLIRQLPNSFEGVAFKEFRIAQQQFRQAEQRRREAEREQWRQILEDPAENDEIKRIAQEALGDVS
jgi:hypothetical protein